MEMEAQREVTCSATHNPRSVTLQTGKEPRGRGEQGASRAWGWLISQWSGRDGKDGINSPGGGVHLGQVKEYVFLWDTREDERMDDNDAESLRQREESPGSIHYMTLIFPGKSGAGCLRNAGRLSHPLPFVPSLPNPLLLFPPGRNNPGDSLPSKSFFVNGGLSCCQ